MLELEKKVSRVLNNYLYTRGEKGFMVSKHRMWRAGSDFKLSE